MLPSKKLRDCLNAIAALGDPPMHVDPVVSSSGLFNRLGVLRTYFAARCTRLHKLPTKFNVIVRAPFCISTLAAPVSINMVGTLHLESLSAAKIAIGDGWLQMPHAQIGRLHNLPMPSALAALTTASKNQLMNAIRCTLSAAFTANPALLLWTIEDVNHLAQAPKLCWTERATAAVQTLHAITNGNAFDQNTSQGAAIARALPAWAYEFASRV